jgi:hypothetical protein
MYRALYALLLLLLAGCAGMNPSSPEDAEDPLPNRTSEETSASGGERPEETAEEETHDASRPVAARELSSGSFGQGGARPEVRVARSAPALTEELGEEVRDRGPGVYLAALWGRKNTGGYSIGLAGAREKDGRILVRLSLKKPPKDAMVTQAITYPYVYVFVPGAAPEDLSFVDARGEELDWPVVEAGG